MRIGIDVGGTFTDFLLVDDSGNSQIYKVLSTPEDPSIGLMNGLQRMASDRDRSVEDFLKDVETIVHGTTVTTNAVLTYTGATTGLLTNAGLRDALEMRRGIREEQYNNRFTNVKPLVPRYLRLPIKGRLDYAGKEIEPLNRDDVASALETFRKEGVEAISICFMNSFANPGHEAETAEMVKEKFPDAYLSVSSTFLPAIRFYDRVSSTVLNSYVGPILKSYLTNLLAKLDGVGYKGVLLIMQSNGGVVSPHVAMDTAAATLLSGPAGGPVAGIAYTSIQGYDDCITVDMGGTSFDAALIKDKTPIVTTEGEINRLRLALPMLGIVTIGAGGGSIGWIDEGGLLRMGPKSAGAKPGPACYGLGGNEPACTDANLVLGYLDPDFFAGGRMKLDLDKAKDAIKTNIADKMGLSLTEAAAGMYDVINVNMAAGIREVSIKRGHDPRDFPLVVAGGAGPAHACSISYELEIPVMIIPRESSIFCAAGMLLSDLKHSFVRTYARPFSDLDLNRFQGLFSDMESTAASLLESENIPSDRIEYQRSLDMRYVKQYHEVNVDISKEEVGGGELEGVSERFHKRHDSLYGYHLREEKTPAELINLRLTAIGRTHKPRFVEQEFMGEDPAGAKKGEREAYMPKLKEYRKLQVFDGFALRHGNRIEGPAIVEQENTTLFLTPEYVLRCDKYGSFTLIIKDREDEFAKKIA